MKSPSICPTSRDYRELIWYLCRFCGFDNESLEFLIGDHRGVKSKYAWPLAHLSRGLALLYPWDIACDVDLKGKGEIRLNQICNSLSSTKTDLLLNSGGEVESVGMFCLRTCEPSQHFESNERADSIVERLAPCDPPASNQGERAPTSMNMSSFFTTFSLCSSVIRCGGFAAITPNTGPFLVMTITLCPNNT